MDNLVKGITMKLSKSFAFAPTVSILHARLESNLLHRWQAPTWLRAVIRTQTWSLIYTCMLNVLTHLKKLVNYLHFKKVLLRYCRPGMCKFYCISEQKM